MTQSTLLQRRALLLLTIAFMVFMFSCKKDPGKIGLELMGENDLDVAHTDTLPLIAYAVPIDSIRTDEGSVSVMGSFCDPTFGTTTSNLVATLWMTRNNPNFGIFPTADSIVAYLDYYGTYYGNIATTQQVEVFELDEKIIFDSTYYSNRRCQHKPNPVGSVAFTPMPTDSVLNPDSTLGRARLRIPLNTGFGQMILDADTSDLKDNITFTEFMKGLLFRFHPITTPGEGALLDMNMVSLRSEVVLYYHNSEDTTTFTMRCSTFTPRYLEVDHDFSTGDPLFVQQLEGDTTLGEEKLYLQGLGGVKTLFRVPPIPKEKPDSWTAINEAKLIIELFDADTSYAPPSQLEVLMYNEEDEAILIPDYREGAFHYGGSYHKPSTSYTFRITKYLQDLVDGNGNNKGLELVISGGAINAERLMFHGTQPQDTASAHSRFRTNIIFTSIKN